MHSIQNFNSNITLEINITIGKDFKKTLTYIQGQDPVLAASLFCEQNNLKPSAVYYIQQAIEQVIYNVEEIQNLNEEQSQIPEGNSYDEYDPRSSDDSGYQNRGPLRQAQQNSKQYSKSPIRQHTKASNQNSANKKNDSDSEKSHRIHQINRGSNQNAGVRLYQKAIIHSQVKEKKLNQIKIQQEQQDLKEATFQPQINFNSLLLSEKQDQYERIQKMKRKKEDRMNQIKLNALVQEQEKCTFQPQIGVVSSRIGQFAKEHREVREVFQHLYIDSYKRQQDKDKKLLEQYEDQEEKNKLECTFTPDINSYNKSFDQNQLSSDRRKISLILEQQQPLIQLQQDNSSEKIQENNNQSAYSSNSSFYSSQIGSQSAREGLITRHPKISTPICSYPKQSIPQQQPQQQLNQQPHYQELIHLKQVQNQQKPQPQKNFFNLENQFQQMKNAKITSPTKFTKPTEKSTEKKIKRSHSVNVWDNLYSQALQQKENQKEFEFKIRQQIQKEINKQKLSLKSKEIINEQRNQIIECIFEVLDSKKQGYISPDNLSYQYLSSNLNKILKPLYDAVLLNNTILDCVQFKKAVKSLYDTIDFSDKLVISRLLQSRSQSLPNQRQNIPKVNPQKREANYVCKRCKTCQDTLSIIDQLDQIKQKYESNYKCNHYPQNY